MTPPLDPATISVIGAGIGSAIGALIIAMKNGRTVQETAKTTKAVEAEINGPGNEPSLRQLVQTVLDAGLRNHDNLHTDMVRLADRVERLENGKGDTIIATTLSAIHDHCKLLSAEMRRARMNIHQIANEVQVRLFTQEEADAKIADDPKFG